MKKTIGIVCCLISAICISSCKENYSNGEKVGNLIEGRLLGLMGRQDEHDTDRNEYQR